MGQNNNIPDVRNGRQFKELTSQIKQKNEELSDLIEARNDLYRSQKLQCPHCNKKSKISDIVIVSCYRYHKSYSSYEDSSYDFTGKYNYICPHCFESFTILDDKFVTEFKPFFLNATEHSLRYNEPSYGAFKSDQGLMWDYYDRYGSREDRRVAPEKVYSEIARLTPKKPQKQEKPVKILPSTTTIRK